MLKQFVDVASSLMLVGLALGALVPALRLATGRDPERPGSRPVLWGVMAGAITSAVALVLHEYSIVRFNRQRLTLTTLEPTVALALLTVILVVLYGRRTLAALKVARSKAERTTILNPNPISPARRVVVSIVAGVWVALAVFREAQLPYMQARTFVPVGASVFSTATFLNVVGYVAGVVLVVVAGTVVFKLCQSRPSLTLSLCVTLILILTSTHVFLILRLLYAIRVIFLPRSATYLMAWLINHETWLILAALALLFLAAVVTWRAGRKMPTADDNPAVARLQRVKSLAMTRRSYLAVGVCAISAVTLTLGQKIASQEVELSEPEPYDLGDKAASIPLDVLNDGHLHRFEYKTSSGVMVRWIVIQKAGSSYGVGLDACEICGPSGYYEKDGQVICKLCSVAMNIATIGFKGGCNPIPIDYEVGNGKLTISLKVLEDSASVFAG